MLAAVHAHNAETIMRTLIHAGADVRIRGTYGRTVLHFAAGMCITLVWYRIW